MPSCTSRDSHKTLSADLESILEKISTDNFAYKKASILRAALKVKCFFRKQTPGKRICATPRDHVSIIR
ncbi:hypothetical protein BC938DRAFT_477773 [Jimgerdemannia flammicorona]|uniref:Uncharacterized protein n=1 Tax=Jimgerdemannia flammicorona TaxID=994334 RepID=A0A433P7U0_9FUNG|nr:hypothetical protein BC938DRAFT_477773 [Jimgerdemannia flammicorona]